MTNPLILTQTSTDLASAAAPAVDPVTVYLSSLQSANSRTTMLNQLIKVARLLGFEHHDRVPWWSLRHYHMIALQTQLAESYSASSVNLMLSAVRGVLTACWRLDLLDHETLARATDFKQLKHNSVQAATGRMLTQSELNKLITVCLADRDERQGLRDAAMIALAYGLGLRRAELVSLNVADVQQHERGGYAVTVRGKGNKTRVGYVAGAFAQLLSDYLAMRGSADGALFQRVRTSGKPSKQQRLNQQAVYDMYAARGNQAGIESFSPHDMRRTCISNLLSAGVDLGTVAAIVGHANVQTTAKYDRRGERAKQDAANNLHIAYSRKRLV